MSFCQAPSGTSPEVLIELRVGGRTTNVFMMGFRDHRGSQKAKMRITYRAFPSPVPWTQACFRYLESVFGLVIDGYHQITQSL
jgi:hypothetical protein